MPGQTIPQLSLESNIAQLEEFRYAPLDRTRGIRLLKASRQGENKRLTCSFTNVSLDERPQFIAISYAWGEPTLEHRLNCDGNTEMRITSSVKAILQNFADVKDTPYLWIDAICINQSDKDEKAHQIRLMSHIYSGAKQVDVWLGEPTHDSTVAMELIEKVHSSGILQHRSQISAETVCQVVGHSWPGPEWTALQRLLIRPWFQRMWVVQEVILASIVRLHCGAKSISWESIANLMAMMTLHGLHALLLDLHTETDAQMEQLQTFDAIQMISAAEGFRHFRRTGTPISVQDLLIECFQYKTFEPRDKIYGLLGVADDADDPVFDPDYEMSVEEVYTKTARYMLTSEKSTSLFSKNKSISVLHVAGLGFARAMSGLPSWVPDWTSYPALTCFGNIAFHAEFTAAGKTKPRVRASTDGRRLLVKGILLDSIIFVTPPCPVASSDISTMPASSSIVRQKDPTEVGKWLDAAKRRLPSFAPFQRQNGPDWQEVYWRTLIADRAQSVSEPASPVYGRYFQAFLLAFPMLPGGAQSLVPTPESAIGAGTFRSAMSHAAVGRSLLVSALKFMGLTAPETRPGDLICLVLGADTPFVLRRNSDEEGMFDGTYSLVGECYVHGLMKGEGMQLGEVQEFTLT